MIQKGLNALSIIRKRFHAFLYKIISSLGQNLTAGFCSLRLLKFLREVFFMKLFHVLYHLLLCIVLLLEVVRMQRRQL